MAAKPVPEGWSTVTPYMIVDGAAKVLEFAKQAFDAEERSRMDIPGGKIGHAEIKIGDSIVMIADPPPDGTMSPMPAMLYVYVEDVDATYKRALAAGATSVEEPKDQFYGDRSAAVRDTAGNYWSVATHIEDVPPDEMERRAKEWMAQQQG